MTLKRAKKVLPSLLVLGSLGAMSVSSNASACGTESYIGSVCLMATNFCPRGTEMANGQLLAISSNSALFSLIGTAYGGDGRTTFGLPDLRGRSPMGQGNAPGSRYDYKVGQTIGSETHTLTVNEMPQHTHSAVLQGGTKVMASTEPGTSNSPDGGKVLSAPPKIGLSDVNVYGDAADTVALGGVTSDATVTVGNAGGSQPFNINGPRLAMTYCIVTQGIFPSRQ